MILVPPGKNRARPSPPEHLYRRVADRMSRLIEQGTLRAGEKIPSVRRLCRQEAVSVATILQAYRLMESRGLVEARPQSGYYVRAKRWNPPPEPGKSKPQKRTTQVRVGDLVMEVLQVMRDPKLVRLGAGFPDASLFPSRELHRAMAAAARRNPAAQIFVEVRV